MASKIKKKQPRGEKNELDLNIIEQLGGSKADLDLVSGIDDDDEGEVVDLSDEFDDEPIKKDEINDFIKKLGIREQFEDDDKDEKKSKKDKKKKLLVASEESGDQAADTVVAEPASVETKPKKQRNKYKVQHDEVSSTTPPVSSSDLQSHIRRYKPRTYQLVKPGQVWLAEQDLSKGTSKELPSDLERQMESFASKLLEDEVEVYNKKRESSKKSEAHWIKTILSSGTLSDKIAALTLLVQESPGHNLVGLDSLISMAKKKGKRECMMATDTLRELFTTYLLPEERKLKHFSQNPLAELQAMAGGNRDTLDRRLLQWSYESKLKDSYSSFIKALDMMSHDTLLATKQKALGAVFEMLVSKPEEEKTLLSMLVNKVGDPDYKLASKATHYLAKLVDRHPNMKAVVVGEVERVLYRPNIPEKAQYYCICFLNQLLLSHEEKDLASKLIGVYFSFFKVFVKKGEVDNKMMSALLSGVNRAYPFAKVDEDYISTQMNTLYKIVHIVNFNTSLQALMLLYQVMDSSQNVSDRYYIALYKKMADPALKSSSKQAMFLNLLFKSIKKDIVERRVQAFVKRLLQVCSYQPAQFVCGALVLLGEILKAKPSIMVTSHTVPEDSDDEEEHFKDLPDPDEEDLKQSSDSDEESEEQQSPNNKTSSWVHKSNVRGGKVDSSTYDPLHRNPLYCRAEMECIWELRKLANHFHPSVSLFASNIIKGQSVMYTGDPLQDFTTIRFLDRFVYKNPKKKDSVPALSGTLSKSMLKHSNPKGVKKIAVDSEKYLKRGEESIPVDEKFLYRYFAQKAEKKKTLQGDIDEASETESVSDAEFDDFLDGYEKQFEEEGWEDMKDLDFDFAGAFGKKKGKKGKKSKGYESDEEEDDDDDDDMGDLSDEEMDFGGDDFAAEFQEFDNEITAGFDEENVEYSDDDELAELQPKSAPGKKRKAGGEKALKNKKQKGNEDDIMGMFASAEEFSHLLEENSGSQFDMTGTAALANKDNAHVKQLKWEVDRDRWMSKKGNRKRNMGGKKGGLKKKKC